MGGSPSGPRLERGDESRFISPFIRGKEKLKERAASAPSVQRERGGGDQGAGGVRIDDDERGGGKKRGGRRNVSGSETGLQKKRKGKKRMKVERFSHRPDHGEPKG